MKQTGRILLLGLMVWAIPFIAGFFFYNEEGKLAADIFLFKTAMLLMLMLSLSLALNLHFKKVESNFVKQGLIVGGVWLLISLLLDVVTVIPMSAMSVQDYTVQIGMRYLSIPIISLLCGKLLHRATTKK